ncbi:hypothetical protein N0V88_003862 [Collariella sp. IMI 366227]|nr:hypothetical protein N0V88_003862 [Collariella sp. IMI 366227]
MAQIVAQGAGRVHGIDSSRAMIEAAQASIKSAGLADKCTFEGKFLLRSFFHINGQSLTDDDGDLTPFNWARIFQHRTDDINARNCPSTDFIMSADDQAFLDVLSSLPNDIQKYTRDVADFVDRHVDQIAGTLRDTIAKSDWVPEQFRPHPPPPPSIVTIPTSALERAQNWISRHKFLVGFIVVVTGTVAYKSYRSSARWRKSRRAKRARSGGRVEVVVIAGSPALPLTRSLSLDLERKGFIVFIVSNSHEDEQMVQNLSRPDIRPLSIDITDPPNAGTSIDHFARYLQSPHAAIPNGKRHHLSLKANAPPQSPRLHPSIISSINPPFHAPEATVCSALSAFTEVLTAELRPLGIPVTHMQLGTFDFSGFTPAANSRLVRDPQGLLPAPDDGPEALPWPESARQAYGKNFVSQYGSAISAGRIRGMRGSSLRSCIMLLLLMPTLP